MLQSSAWNKKRCSPSQRTTAKRFSPMGGYHTYLQSLLPLAALVPSLRPDRAHRVCAPTITPPWLPSPARHRVNPTGTARTAEIPPGSVPRVATMQPTPPWPRGPPQSVAESLGDVGLHALCRRRVAVILSAHVPSSVGTTGTSRPSSRINWRRGFNAAAATRRSSASCFSSMIPMRRAFARALEPATNRPSVNAVSGG